MNLFKKDGKKSAKTSSALKYGGYASVMTAVFVVAVIIINLIVNSFGIKADLTKNKLYTLSEDTITLLKNLDEDVSVTSVYEEGNEISVVKEILNKYASYSKHITVNNVDPYTNPSFATKYAKNGDVVSIGSVVVETAQGYRIISQDQLADVSTDSVTGETYIQGLKLESVLTGAIRSLTGGATQSAYELTGHSEIALGDGLKQELSYSGLDVKQLDLVTAGNVPDDCQVLIINGATSDISDNELKAVNDYLNNGGAMFITLGITSEDTKNIDSLLANYGIENNKLMVIEGSADRVYNNNPFYIVPELSKDSTITSAMAEGGTNVFMPFSSAVELSQTKRSTVEITTLAQSSQYSYGKDLATMNDYAKADSDPEGPFNIAVSAEDSDGGVRLVVCGSESLMEDDINNIINGGNFGFILNCMEYLRGSDTSSYSKSIVADSYLQLSQSKAMIIMFGCVIVIPVAILIAGIIVVLKRRNK